MKQLSAKVSGDLKETIKALSVSEERSISQIVERLLRTHPEVIKKTSSLELAA